MKNIIKHISTSFLLVLSLVCASIQANPYGPVTIAPASGTYLDNNQFDFTVIVHMPGEKIRNAQYYHNGNNITNWLRDCMSEGVTLDGYPYLSCEGLSGAKLGTGQNSIHVTIQMNNGMNVHGEVEYTILQTQIINSNVFELPASQPEFVTGVVIEHGARYEIMANGQTNLWPQNPGFPIATPRGNGTSCNYSACKLPGGPTGALVARIDSGPWFLVGAHHVIQGGAIGDLRFSVNDHNLSDNLGSFTVEVKKLPQ